MHAYTVLSINQKKTKGKQKIKAARTKVVKENKQALAHRRHTNLIFIHSFWLPNSSSASPSWHLPTPYSIHVAILELFDVSFCFLFCMLVIVSGCYCFFSLSPAISSVLLGLCPNFSKWWNVLLKLSPSVGKCVYVMPFSSHIFRTTGDNLL